MESREEGARGDVPELRRDIIRAIPVNDVYRHTFTEWSTEAVSSLTRGNAPVPH